MRGRIQGRIHFRQPSYAISFENRPVSQVSSWSIPRDKPSFGNLFSVYEQSKITEIVMSKIVPVVVQRAEKIYVLYHSKQKTFGDGF